MTRGQCAIVTSLSWVVIMLGSESRVEIMGPDSCRSRELAEARKEEYVAANRRAQAQRELRVQRQQDIPATAVRTMTVPAATILPLRAFLGVTFVYAAFQKLTDPGFLTPGAGTYIGAQLLGFSRGSPIGFLLQHMAEHAAIIGVLTILAEFAIGLAVLLGLFTRLAALGGLALNLVFFLSASWHTYPYFMGSDIVFVVAWLTLAITGPGPWALDDAIWRMQLIPDQYRRLVLGQSPSGINDAARIAENRVMTRREVVAGMLAAGFMVLLGLIPRSQPTAASSLGGSTSTGSSGGTSGGSSSPSGSSS